MLETSTVVDLLLMDIEIVIPGMNESKPVELLFKHANSIVNTQEIKSCIGDDADHNDESLRQLVYRVRKKLPDLDIRSSSKVGYLIECA